MRSTEKKGFDGIKLIFRILIVAVFLYFLLGELLLPSQSLDKEYRCEVYTGEWIRYLADGTSEKVEMPGKYEVKRNEKVHLETTLPFSIPNGMSMCFWSNRQDFEIYIDGQLRQEYSTDSSRLFGKSSSGSYVFVELRPEDAGKILTLYSQTDTDYSGTFSKVYYGNQMGIWKKFYEKNSAEFIISLAMILLSVFAIIVSVFLWIVYRRRIAMEFMGWVVLLAAVWILGNSGIRQILFPNVSVLNEITFYMIMLLPFPFLFFMDIIQKRRYHKVFFVMGILSVIDFVVCTGLQLANIKDFTDTIVLMAGSCILTILVIAITLIMDIFTHKIRDYFFIAIGIGCTLTAAIVQIGLYFQRSGSFNGTILSLGLLGLLFLTAFSTIQDVFRLEKEKQQAILASQSKVQFLANMSHEIRTPINAVLGMDEMILRESKSGNITEYAQDIQSAGRSLLSLINDILDFSKIESGKMEILPVEYDLASVLNDCYHMIAMRAREKNLELHVENDPLLPSRLYGDEVRIRQIITNLLTNGVKYTEQGHVTLQMTGERSGDYINLRVAVKDTGIGIAEENMKKLFDSFQRVEEIRNRNIEGTGLGLAITKQLVELMDGRIWVESQYGKGSVFYVEFPQKIISDEEIGDFAERYRKNMEKMKDYKESFIAPEARLLVVDDVPMNLKVIQGLLKSTEIQIETAESGKQCLDMIKRKTYHLIMLDHMMPEMDGIETLHRMMEMEDYPSKDAKVIMLTANAIMGAKEEYLSEGFCDYLSKPVRANELEEMVSKHLPPEMVMYKSEETTWVEPKKQEETEEAEETVEKTFLEKLDFLDVQTGLTYCAEDEDFYKEMLRDYMEGNKIPELTEMYDGEDWENYRIQIHALKSTSLSIGAVELSEEAKQLEQAAKDDNIEFIRLHHEETIKQYQMLLQRLSQLL